MRLENLLSAQKVILIAEVWQKDFGVGVGGQTEKDNFLTTEIDINTIRICEPLVSEEEGKCLTIS